jgi:hypothetical protein
MSIDYSEYPVHDNVSADTLVAGDQTFIDGDVVVITRVDSDRPDIDEIRVYVDNLTGDDDYFDLYADDRYDLWSY